MKIMNRKEKIQYTFWVVLWMVINIVFWCQWLEIRYIGNWILYIPISLALFYESTLLPSFYLFFLGKMRQPKQVTAPSGLKVAMITLCVPSSESIGVIERQLAAMSAVKYPHDSWILDEGNNPKVKALAEKYGVHYFTRKGVDKYNQSEAPFKAKTKAGNVNSWLNAHGFKYEYFVQLDIDHLPCPEYLDMTLGYLAEDSNVAWVQAPSVYGNYEESWAARGSSEQELVLQGPLQMGFYGFSQTPFIIGSHCTYRMSAIREINGFQPTRAEDHLDTVILASRGYRGVFVPEIIATGDGPESFDTYLAQQFAWAYSMIQVLFHYTPKLVRHYTPRQAVQFLFAQTWYCFWSTSMLLMYLMPVIALITNNAITKNISFMNLASWYLPLPITAYVVFRWSRKWHRPEGLKLSWRGMLLHVARWPVVIWALINVILGVQKPYMITPKGKANKPFNLEAHLPYFGLVVASVGGVLWYKFRIGSSDVQGNLIFVLAGAFFIAAVYAIAVLSDLQEIRQIKTPTTILRMRFKPVTVLAALVLSLLGATVLAAPLITEAAVWHPMAIRLVSEVDDTVFDPSFTFVTAVPKVDQELEADQLEDVFEPAQVVTEQAKVIELPAEGVALGVYDPNDNLSAVQLDVEHHFVVWYRMDQLQSALDQAQINSRVPLISLEPWAWNEEGPEMTSTTLITDVNVGLYDQYIRESAREIKSTDPQKVIVRWGHEFELIGLYPWSTDAEAYVSAYRRVVGIFRDEEVDNVLWMWSPAGLNTAVDYYPGSDYVDMIGITILSDLVWEQHAGFDEPRSFRTLQDEKYWIADYFSKPIWVAEVGVSSETNVQVQWLKDAESVFDQYPSLKGFIYFNRVNQHAPVGMHYPDYSLTLREWKEVFEESLYKIQDNRVIFAR